MRKADLAANKLGAMHAMTRNRLLVIQRSASGWFGGVEGDQNATAFVMVEASKPTGREKGELALRLRRAKRQ
jgi:hypothetical protein